VNVRPQTRIQKKNREAILDAALDAFSQGGFRGTTLDQIAELAGLSKPNLLYYFPSKDAIHAELVGGLLGTWIGPLSAIDEAGEPVDEIVRYVLAKLKMSRRMPRESRLFAGEILHGAPRLMPEINGPLRTVLDEKADVIAGWSDAGRLAPVDPRHLIFSIWSTTQHYADFDVQVRALLKPRGDSHFDDAASFLENFYRRALTPR
jgi:TetR/AcrR family transcriptional regulator